MNEGISINPDDANNDDKRFLEEIRFIEEKGREPDIIDELEMIPNYTITRLAEKMDLYTHTAATILTLLRALEGSGAQFDKTKVKEIMSKFNADGEYTRELMKVESALVRLQDYLRTQIEEEKYFDEVLPQVKELEQRLKSNSEFFLTGGDSGEPLGN